MSVFLDYTPTTSILNISGLVFVIKTKCTGGLVGPKAGLNFVEKTNSVNLLLTLMNVSVVTTSTELPTLSDNARLTGTFPGSNFCLSLLTWPIQQLTNWGSLDETTKFYSELNSQCVEPQLQTPVLHQKAVEDDTMY
jgi:hypothetical protein